MLRIVFLCFAFVSSGVTGGYPDGSTGNNVGTSDSSANSFGYGYSGSFAGGNPANIPGPVFDFQRFLSGYLENINRYHQEFIKNLQGIASQAGQVGQAGSVYPPSAVYGTSGIHPGGSGLSGGYGGSFAGPNGVGIGVSVPDAVSGAGSVGVGTPLFSRVGDQGAAFASGSIGADGIQQTAAVYPENQGSPNVNTRFAASDQPGGYRSVFTSSQSHTTTVNGKPHTIQQASTTVNDNGKITTYTAKNP